MVGGEGEEAVFNQIVGSADAYSKLQDENKNAVDNLLEHVKFENINGYNVLKKNGNDIPSDDYINLLLALYKVINEKNHKKSFEITNYFIVNSNKVLLTEDEKAILSKMLYEHKYNVLNCIVYLTDTENADSIPNKVKLNGPAASATPELEPMFAEDLWDFVKKLKSASADKINKLDQAAAAYWIYIVRQAKLVFRDSIVSNASGA